MQLKSDIYLILQRHLLKYRHLVTMLDGLLDELYGACIFWKINL